MGKGMSRILPGDRVEGCVETVGGMCVEGCVCGEVRCGGELRVLGGGMVEGEVECGLLVLEGKVTGNVEAGKAVLREGAEIGGGLVAERVEMAAGVRIGLGLKFKKVSK